jgi:magnesium-transporting ATPase (P-type)
LYLRIKGLRLEIRNLQPPKTFGSIETDMNTAANRFHLDSLSGLSEAEAAKRLKEEGYNELPSASKRRFLAMVFIKNSVVISLE